MKNIKMQNDLATEIKKGKKKSKIDILSQENELLVKSLKKPGWSFKVAANRFK